MRFAITKKTVYGAAVVGAIIVSGYLWSIFTEGDTDPPDGTIHLRYSLRVQNTTNQPVKNARLSVAAPIDLTPSQQCTEVNAGQPFSIQRDESGNQSVQFDWKMIPPLTTKIVKIETEIDVWRNRRKIKGIDPDDFLESEPFIESGNQTIKNLAHQLKGKTSMQTARNMHDWVVDNLEYPGYIKKNRGALYALKHKKGDCTEFAALFVALCRANGIPSRFMGGFVCPKSMVLDLGDYHNWAEFYVDGRWHLADPQRKVFNRDEWTYIAFQVIQTATGNDGFMIGPIKGKGLEVKLKS